MQWNIYSLLQPVYVLQTRESFSIQQHTTIQFNFIEFQKLVTLFHLEVYQKDFDLKRLVLSENFLENLTSHVDPKMIETHWFICNIWVLIKIYFISVLVFHL